MQSSEEAPVHTPVIGDAAVAPEPDIVSEAALVMMAPEPATMREAEPGEETPRPAPIIEAAAEEAVQKGAEVSAPADSDGSKSPAPVSPSKVKERQIPVDPASLRRLGMVADEDSPLSAPSVLTEVVVQSPLLPPLRRPTFVGVSQPCSAVSSPVQGAGPGSGAKWAENPATPSPRAALSSLARQHSAALARLVAAPPTVAPLTLSRSTSRAEGRTMAPHDDEEPADPKTLSAEESFTCGALCMLLPGFSRKKPAAAATTAAGMAMSSMQRQQSAARPRRSSASRLASLERFECGSWSPPPPPVPAAARDSGCHALEVPKISSTDDTESPVKMAFVVDGEAPTRGILKNSASSRLSSARPSTSSQRHVRFSTAAADVAVSCPSSPSGVISPRLARARDEFNAFLEAQSAF